MAGNYHALSACVFFFLAAIVAAVGFVAAGFLSSCRFESQRICALEQAYSVKYRNKSEGTETEDSKHKKSQGI